MGPSERRTCGCGRRSERASCRAGPSCKTRPVQNTAHHGSARAAPSKTDHGARGCLGQLLRSASLGQLAWQGAAAAAAAAG
eukprot:scaffold119216_cov56-Phaeocystis_antarctica.AAC.4